MTKNNTNYSICLVCNQTFLLKRPWQKACSYKCGYTHRNSKKVAKVNHGLCVRCGKSLSNKRSNAIYCSTTCKSMDHNFKQLKSAGKRVTTARRRLIVERDNFACYMCNSVVTLKSAEIDHLIPRSRGGSSSPNNLSTACLPCNRSRGNRIDVEQLVRLQELRTQHDY